MSVSKVLKTILTFVHTLAPIALQSRTSQSKASELCFRVAMLLKTQFTFHCMRGKLTLRKKEIIFL